MGGGRLRMPVHKLVNWLIVIIIIIIITTTTNNNNNVITCDPHVDRFAMTE